MLPVGIRRIDLTSTPGSSVSALLRTSRRTSAKDLLSFGSVRMVSGCGLSHVFLRGVDVVVVVFGYAIVDLLPSLLNLG